MENDLVPGFGYEKLNDSCGGSRELRKGIYLIGIWTHHNHNKTDSTHAIWGGSSGGCGILGNWGQLDWPRTLLKQEK